MSHVIHVVFFTVQCLLKIIKNVQDRYWYVDVFMYVLQIAFISVVFDVRLIHVHLKVLEIFTRQIVGPTKSVRCKY